MKVTERLKEDVFVGRDREFALVVWQQVSEGYFGLFCSSYIDRIVLLFIYAPERSFTLSLQLLSVDLQMTKLQTGRRLIYKAKG